MKVVKITKEESEALEAMHYTYNANKDIFSSLLQGGLSLTAVVANHLNESLVAEFIALEKMKEELGNKYLPKEMSITDTNFSFNFNTHEITYSK